MVYYKVVSCRNLKENNYKDSYMSAMGMYPESVNQIYVEYKIGEWTYPQIKNSKLFVFNNRINAYTYYFSLCKDTHPYLLCFECEIGEIFPTPSSIVLYRSFETFNKYWNGNRINDIHLFNPPSGTILTDKVKLLQKAE